MKKNCSALLKLVKLGGQLIMNLIYQSFSKDTGWKEVLKLNSFPNTWMSVYVRKKRFIMNLLHLLLLPKVSYCKCYKTTHKI